MRRGLPLLCVLMLLACSTAYAVEWHDETAQAPLPVQAGLLAPDSQAQAAFVPDGKGGWVELSLDMLEQVERNLPEVQLLSRERPSYRYLTVYRYEVHARSLGRLPPVKLSADLKGAGTIQYTPSVASPRGEGRRIEQTVPLRFDVPAGRVGYIQFLPFAEVLELNIVAQMSDGWNVIREQLGQTQEVAAKTLADGTPAGIYIFMLR